MRRELDAARATGTVSRVIAERGIEGQVLLLRSGMNLVFRVGDVVVRVVPEHVDGQAHVELAQRLLKGGLPVVRRLDDAVAKHVGGLEYGRAPQGPPRSAASMRREVAV
jgi:hypothetical protein